jgi:hypothetical protein
MPGQRFNIWGRGRKDEVAWWDLRVGKENRETAENIFTPPSITRYRDEICSKSSFGRS